MEGNATSFLVTNVSLLYDNKARIVLLDTGNLVLQDENSKFVWQSFDFPTDTMLPGMKYGYDKTIGKTWSFSAWKNAADPSPGRYSVAIDPIGSGWAMIWDRNQIHGLFWVGYKPNTPRVYKIGSSHINFTTYVNQPNNTFYIVSNVDDKDFFIRYVIDMVGVFQVYYWYKGDRDWTNIMKLPNRVCDFNGYCGDYAICDEYSNSRETCYCFQGFEPRDHENWENQNYCGGCEWPINNLVNNKTKQLDFIKVPNVTLPSNPTFVSQIRKVEDCKSLCSANNSCNGYSYTEHGCWILGGNVTNVQRLSLGLDIYIKVPTTSNSYKLNMSMFLSLLSILVVYY